MQPSSGLQKQSSNSRCFVSNGAGLAPFLSILRRMVEWGEDHPTHLFLGVNNQAEILCQDELNTLQQNLPHLTCVWKLEGNWSSHPLYPVFHKCGNQPKTGR